MGRKSQKQLLKDKKQSRAAAEERRRDRYRQEYTLAQEAMVLSMGAIASNTFTSWPKAQLPVSGSTDDKDKARLLAAQAKRLRKAQQRIQAQQQVSNVETIPTKTIQEPLEYSNDSEEK
jgi:hypothetical protein